MAHGDARKGRWRGKWRMEWLASTLHTISEHGVSSITTADAHTSAASSRLNWRPQAYLNRLVRFARKTKSGFCACAITFQTRFTLNHWRMCAKCRCTSREPISNKMASQCFLYVTSQILFSEILYVKSTKIRIFNTNVKSVVLCGCETWKLAKTIVHQLQVLVNRRIRRMLKIFWPVQISNQETVGES